MLDAYGVAAAHVVGVSAGGALVQLLALDFAGRVRSLVLISTSPARPAIASCRHRPRRSGGSCAAREWTGPTPTP